MLRFIILISFIGLSCSYEPEHIICYDHEYNIESNLDPALYFKIPNIIMPNDQGYALLSLALGSDRLPDSLIHHNYKKALALELKILNEDNDPVHESNAIVFDSLTGIYQLWDGYIEGEYYSGLFYFDLYLEYENGQYLLLETSCMSLSCEDYYRIIENENNLGQFADCRYHYGYVYLPVGDPAPVYFCE